MSSSTSTRGSIAIESTLMLLIATTLLISISLIIVGSVVKENIEYGVHESIGEMIGHPLAVPAGETIIRQKVMEGLFLGMLDAKVKSSLPSSFGSFIDFSTKHSYYNALTGEGRVRVNARLKALPLTLLLKDYCFKTFYRGDGNVNGVSKTVYITKTGKKYHYSGCMHLNKSKIPVSLEEAIDRGYQLCKNCKKGTKKKK